MPALALPLPPLLGVGQVPSVAAVALAELARAASVVLHALVLLLRRLRPPPPQLLLPPLLRALSAPPSCMHACAHACSCWSAALRACAACTHADVPLCVSLQMPVHAMRAGRRMRHVRTLPRVCVCARVRAM